MNKLTKIITITSIVLMYAFSTQAIQFDNLLMSEKQAFLRIALDDSFYMPEKVIALIEEKQIEDLELFKQGLLLIQSEINEQTLANLNTLIVAAQTEAVNLNLLLSLKEFLQDYAEWTVDQREFRGKLRAVYIQISDMFVHAEAFTETLNAVLPQDLQIIWQLVYQHITHSDTNSKPSIAESIDAFIASCIRYASSYKSLWLGIGEKAKEAAEEQKRKQEEERKQKEIEEQKRIAEENARKEAERLAKKVSKDAILNLCKNTPIKQKRLKRILTEKPSMLSREDCMINKEVLELFDSIVNK